MFTFLLRTIGLWTIAGAIVAMVIDGMKSIASGRVVLTPLGQTWFDLAPASLNTAQAAVQRYVHPYLWDPVIQWILLWPTWAVLMVIGVLFVAVGSRRKRDVVYVIG